MHGALPLLRHTLSWCKGSRVYVTSVYEP
jgi:hypothetical protein